MKLKACLFVACLVSPALGLPSRPKRVQGKDRVHETELSKEEHTSQTNEHNSDYDHEAFLGREDAQAFKKLTPEQSKYRLRVIAMKVDADKNGQVTEEELKNWIKFTQNRYVLEDVERQWKSHDLDGDGAVTWPEYRNSTYGPITDEEIEKDESYSYKDMIKRDKRRWEHADTDGDKQLSKAEFGAFLHPEEHDHMKMLVVQETLEDIDKDKDGQISMEEYMNDMYPPQDRREDEPEPEWVKTERDSFKTYRDKNGDGFMDKDEVKHWIIPEDYDHASSEAKHLIYEADTTPKDNQLTIQEIVNKYDLFAGSQVTDYGEALNRHDEF